MKKRSPVGFLSVVLVLTMVGGVLAASQWKKTLLLRSDLAALKARTVELRRLEAENRRLKAQQVPATELERLRADHAVVGRLRAELEALQRRGSPAATSAAGR